MNTLQQLFETIEKRKGADASTSYTASLFQKGRSFIAQKCGEEAVELIIEAIQNNREKSCEESADLLYHLLVLWADMNVSPDEIFAILAKRMSMSGLEEKAQRPS